MSTQGGPQMWDEEVDLRRWIIALIRYKWIILTFLVSAVAIASIFNYILLPPTYQSSVTVSLPSATGENARLINYTYTVEYDRNFQLNSPSAQQQMQQEFEQLERLRMKL